MVEEDSLLFKDEIEIKRKNGNLARVFLFLASFLQVLASLQVVISWLDVLTKLGSMFSISESLFSERKLKIFITVFNILFLFMFALCVSFQYFNELALFWAFGSFALVIGYIVGYFRFSSKLSEYNELIQSQNSNISNYLNLVKRSFQVNTICYCGVLLFGLIYAIGGVKYLEIVRIGGFNYFRLFIDIALLFGIIVMIYTTYYCHVINIRLMKRNDITWIPFTNKFIKSSVTNNNIGAQVSL